MNNRFIPVLTLLLVVGGFSSIISYSVIWAYRSPDVEDTSRFDVWLHKKLRVTAEQEVRMASTETAFHQEQRDLIKTLHELDDELADVLLAEKRESPRVQEVLERIQASQRRLQEASVNHVFQMEKHLTPEQYEQLLSLTAGALRSH